MIWLKLLFLSEVFRVIFKNIVRLLAVIAPERLRFAALNPTVILKTPIECLSKFFPVERCEA